MRLRDSKKSTFTSASGGFSIYAPKKGTLIVSYIGYLNRELTLLGEVSVLSSGYQEIANERATGSVEVINTDPNLLRRLEGLTTSMDFNNQLVSSNSGNDMSRHTPLLNPTIRGKNTLNPNNVINSSGQVLKDAAAASIWGSRASNGVIVVKTKRGGAITGR